MSDPGFGALLELSEDELFERLGAELLGEGLGFGPEDAARYRRVARRWFDERLDQFRSTVCSAGPVQSLITAPTGDRLVEATTVLDIVTGFEGDTTHAILLSVLITRFGLATFCATHHP
jgi:hypothetical protein